MYADESGDSGTSASSSPLFVLSGMIIHESFWEDTIRRIKVMRDKLFSEYGFSRDDELHAGKLLTRPKDSYGHLGKLDRLLMLKKVLLFEAALDTVTIINVVVDKRGHSTDCDVFSCAWGALINRFEWSISTKSCPHPYGDNFEPAFKDRGLLIADETDERKLRILTRNMRENNCLPSVPASDTSSNSRTRTIIEDPMHKNSKDSEFIQLCDVNSYFLLQSISPNSTVKRHQAHNYFYYLEPILCKRTYGDNKYGIVRV